MSTFYSQNNGSFSTTTNWDTVRTGGGTDPASANEAGMAGHTFVIQPGHSIEFDMDMSGWSGTTGLYALTIEGDATNPGMLYCKYSAAGTYHLRIQGGSAALNVIQGTSATVLGRILANSDGVWANSTALPNDRKFVIEYMGTTAGKLIDQYLDVKLLCVNPTNKFVHVYGTKYTFDAATGCNPSTDTITLNTTAPAEGTDVVLVPSAGATLPTGLYADRVYYVRDNSGSDCKLATTNSDDTIVDITADGSGTINVLTEPSSGAGTYTLNVLEDVTADSPWSDVTGHNRVVLVDAGAPGNCDQQRGTISDITDADTIVISETIDSAQYAGCRLWLSSRNISIRSNSTSSLQSIIDSVNTSRGTGNIYQCEIVALAGTGTTFYCYGINYGSGHTISGSISGCSYGINYGSGHTISGSISGCSSGLYFGSGHTVSGSISGCNYGLNSGLGYIVSGSISGCNYGIYYGSGHIVSGSISGCNYGIYYGSGHTVSGSISGCNYGFRDAVGFITVKRGASVQYAFYTRGAVGQKFRIAAEDYGGTGDAAKVFDNAGDIIKTACDGATPGYPDSDPDSGSGYAIEASNLQYCISAVDPLYLISDRSPHRIWLAAGTYTITYKVMSSWGISDNGLTIAATYISDDSPRTITRSTDSQAITQKTSDTDWTQTLAITITTAAAGWVDLEIYLTEYNSGGYLFVWPTPVIT